MSEGRELKAVKLMRDIRDRLARDEDGLTWEQRKAKLHQDLETNPLWKRLKTIARPATSESGKGDRFIF